MPVVLAGPARRATARSRGSRRATARGWRRAVEHLAALGHERIGFFGGRAELEHVQVRGARLARGAGRGRAAAGPGRARGRRLRARRRWRCSRERPTAVVCASDVLAIGVRARRRAELGLRVPEDVSVTGFDDSPLAALATPALTSVRVDYAEFGAAAADALLAAIGGEPAPVYSPSAPELVVRASTARRRRR